MWAFTRKETPPRQSAFDYRIGALSVRCEVSYSARRKRSIALKVLGPGQLRILAPGHYSHAAVLDFLHSRAPWIQRHLTKLAQRPCPWSNHIRDGSVHPWQGQPLTLQWHRRDDGGKRLSLDRHGSHLLAKIPAYISTEQAEARLAKALNRWYRQQAEGVFNQRLSHWVKQIDWLREPPELKLRAMKSRWGSCSARGHITLNTQLIKTPPECLDYVVVHELCHLREMNHGPAFYALQSAVLPDWKARKDALAGFYLPE